MDKDWLAARLGEGRSIESLARELGRSPSTVQYWVKKSGLRSAHADRHAAKGGIDRERLDAMLDRGLSLRAIAKEIDMSYSAVRRWMIRYELESARDRRRALIEAMAERGESVVLDCPAHGRTLHVVRVDGGGLRCLLCRSAHVGRRRRTVKATLVAEHGGRCILCGYDRSISALHFHHIDPATKEFGVASRGVSRSLARARAEARKCVLLCANCHAEVESGLAGLPLSSGPADTQDRAAPALTVGGSSTGRG